MMMRWLMVILFLGNAARAADAPRGQIETIATTEYYEVRGRNVTEVRKVMNEQGPRNGKLDRRFDARTDWEVNWKYQYDGGLAKQGFFRLTKWQIDLKINVIMPQWENVAEALPFERRAWQVYLARLKLHEDGHVKIAERTAVALNESLNTIGFYTSKAKLEGAIKERADKILRKYSGQHIDYDRRTQHGKTQGARFP